jgi:predicted nucleic acid-binding protein
MTLVDTSIWIDHFRAANPVLQALLNDQRVLSHPHVIGEISLGRFPKREAILSELHDLPRTAMASDREVLYLIDSHGLLGSGIGYINAHLVTAVLLTSGASLWSRDKRLAVVASRMKIAADVTTA